MGQLIMCDDCASTTITNCVQLLPSCHSQYIQLFTLTLYSLKRSLQFITKPLRSLLDLTENPWNPRC